MQLENTLLGVWRVWEDKRSFPLVRKLGPEREKKAWSSTVLFEVCPLQPVAKVLCCPKDSYKWHQKQSRTRQRGRSHLYANTLCWRPWEKLARGQVVTDAPMESTSLSQLNSPVIKKKPSNQSQLRHQSGFPVSGIGVIYQAQARD